MDGRFAKDIKYLFVEQYTVEAKQVMDDTNNFLFRQRPTRQENGQVINAGLIKDTQTMQQFVHRDYAFKFMKNIRGSPAYFQRTFYDLLGMIRQLDIPTWFLTLSAADMKWPDVIQSIARQYGTIITEDDVKNMTYQDKTKWLRSNPVTAARHFHYRLNSFFQNAFAGVVALLHHAR